MIDGEVQWQGVDAKRWKVAKDFLEGRECEITIGPKRKKRSLSQNAYYWSCIVSAIAEEAGYGPEDHEAVHEELKARFLNRKGTETGFPIVLRYSKLTTVEAEEYHSHCRRFASEFFGRYIPLPNEVVEA